MPDAIRYCSILIWKPMLETGERRTLIPDYRGKYCLRIHRMLATSERRLGKSSVKRRERQAGRSPQTMLPLRRGERRRKGFATFCSQTRLIYLKNDNRGEPVTIRNAPDLPSLTWENVAAIQRMQQRLVTEALERLKRDQQDQS